jgi:hypothetical protein
MLADGVDPNQPSALILRDATVQQPGHNRISQQTLSAVGRGIRNEKGIVVTVGALHNHGTKLRGKRATPIGAT